MSIPTSIKQQACEGLLHYYPKKTLARELKVSAGSIRDWSILIENNNFDWITARYMPKDPKRLEKAVDFWLSNQGLGYSAAARRFGLRPATLFNALIRNLNKQPAMLKGRRIRFWDPPPPPSLGELKMQFNKLSDIPADRALTQAERKALFKALQKSREETRVNLICTQSLLEVELESCRDEFKKKLFKQQLEQIEKELQSL